MAVISYPFHYPWTKYYTSFTILSKMTILHFRTNVQDCYVFLRTVFCIKFLLFLRNRLKIIVYSKIIHVDVLRYYEIQRSPSNATPHFSSIFHWIGRRRWWRRCIFPSFFLDQNFNERFINSTLLFVLSSKFVFHFCLYLFWKFENQTIKFLHTLATIVQ